MLPAQKRNQRIAFERTSATRGALGQPGAASWAALGSRWALVRYGSGSERMASALESAVQAATFRVLADTLTTTVLATDRIAFGGLTWDITAIAPIVPPGFGSATEIEFTATAARG